MESNTNTRHRLLQTAVDIYNYRTLLYYMVVMDLKVRYRNSVLGFLWTLLNPILLMLVLWFVFGRFRPAKTDNFAMFLLAGIMGWTFFSSAISSSLTSILRQGAIMRKIYLPKVIFPLATVLSQSVNFFFFLLAYALLALILGPGVHWTWVFLPLSALMLFMGSLGFSFILSALNVYFRDITHITAAVLRAWFYCTPILYSVEMFGDKRWVLYLNPATLYLDCLRDPLFFGRVPAWEIWVGGFLVSALLITIGHAIFRKLEHDFIYYV